MGRRGGATIVKLGGSLAASADLPAWLDAIALCPRRIVVVPGGGPFADVVRLAQPKMRFDDHAAHHMAVLAMEQFGCALANLHERVTLAPSVAGIRRALRDGAVPLWAPAPMVLGAPHIDRKSTRLNSSHAHIS